MSYPIVRLSLNRYWLLLTFLLAGFGCSLNPEPAPNIPVPVNKVEIAQYLGEWFAVARIPNRFEADCLQSRAEYSLRKDSTIRVLNSCPTRQGGHESIEGRGWIVSQSNAELQVGFFQIFGWYPKFARGDYWILGLGPVDETGLYSYAVVGEESRKYGWILSRSEQLEQKLLLEAFETLKAQGYSPDDFEMLSEQSRTK